MQTLLPHMLSHQSTNPGKKLIEMAKQVGANCWSGKWNETLDMYPAWSLLAIDCGGATDIFLNKSLMKYKDAGGVVFTMYPMENEEWIWYYCCSLI